MIGGVHCLAVGAAAAMRDPRSAARPHHRLQRRYQPARRLLNLQFSVIAVMDVRFAVGNSNDLSVGQIFMNDVLEGVGAPTQIFRVDRLAPGVEVPDEPVKFFTQRRSLDCFGADVGAFPKMFQCLPQPRPPQSHHPYDRDHAGHCSDNSNDRQQKGDVASRLRRSPGGKRQVVQHDQVSRDPLRCKWIAADKYRPMTFGDYFKFTRLIA